jgi:hypothetical protein
MQPSWAKAANEKSLACCAKDFSLFLFLLGWGKRERHFLLDLDILPQYPSLLMPILCAAVHTHARWGTACQSLPASSRGGFHGPRARSNQVYPTLARNCPLPRCQSSCLSEHSQPLLCHGCHCDRLSLCSATLSVTITM